MRARRTRIIPAFLLLAILLAVSGAAAPIADPAFQRTWERTDKPVADGAVSRTWMWGPAPFTEAASEPYAESPGGTRTVQYFDKSRMEITNPSGDQQSIWYVTNGLLVVELVSGRMQLGDDTFESYPAAQVNVVGDPDAARPITYALLDGLRSAGPLAVGTSVTATAQVGASGGLELANDPNRASAGVAAAYLAPETRHSVASVFWDFMHATGPIWVDGALATAALFPDPFYATGLPINEAYWTTALVGGQERVVLFQCFERRCLTYTPDNPPGWQVEAGNVGQHYYRWRTEVTQIPADRLFTAELRGGNEVPPVATNAWGRASFLLTGDGAAIVYQISASDVPDATAIYLHEAPAGVANSTVLLTFWLRQTDGTATSSREIPPPPSDDIVVTGTLTDSSLPGDLSVAELADKLAGGGTYVNVYTQSEVMGELRGQVSEPLTLDFFATLTGNTDASGGASLQYHGPTAAIDYTLEVADLDGANAAHLHLGTVAEQGGVVAPLFAGVPPVSTGTLATGRIEAGDLLGALEGQSVAALAYELHRGNTFVNVHTSQVPSGEIAGNVEVPLPALHYVRGVNLSGAEWGTDYPGTYGYDYIYPSEAQVDYYAQQGFDVIRLAFSWERMQRALYAELDEEELARFDQVIGWASERGMHVITDPHNFATYDGEQIGSDAVPYAAFADFWERLAEHLRDNPGVYAYGLMNEPFQQDGRWAVAAQAAIDAIRAVDMATPIVVAGDHWSSAWFWPEQNPAFPLDDPADNLIYEAHVYLDDDAGGDYRSWDEEGAYPLVGVDRVRPFVDWLRAHGARGMVTEYGVPGDDERWLTALENLLFYLDGNALGGAAWAGGLWWDADYPLSLEPLDGMDRPQMEVLRRHLGDD